MSKTSPCLCGDPDCLRCFPRTAEQLAQEMLGEKVNISRCTIELESGNMLEMFFNHNTKLLVVDLIDGGGEGGNELVRCILDEDALLQHCRDLRTRKEKRRKS